MANIKENCIRKNLTIKQVGEKESGVRRKNAVYRWDKQRA